MSENEKSVMWRTCDDCDTNYSFVSTGCPSCKSRNSTVHHGAQYPKYIIHVQDSCWLNHCKQWTISKPPICSKCFDYGKIDNGIKFKSDSVKRIECMYCQGAICCIEEFCIRNHDKERINKITGYNGGVTLVAEKINKKVKI